MSMENASKAVYTMYSKQRTDEVQTSVLHTNRSSNERLLEIENRNVMPSIHKSFKIDIARGINSLDL